MAGAQAGRDRRGPRALSRTWCLYELAHTAPRGCELRVVLSEKERQALPDKLASSLSFAMVYESLSEVDVRSSLVGHAADREPLSKALEAMDGGLDRVSQLLRDTMMRWLARQSRAALLALPTQALAMSALVSTVSSLLATQGVRMAGLRRCLKWLLCGPRCVC